MAISTSMVAGLASGFDWRTMIDDLMAAEHGRVDLIEDKKEDCESRFSEWQSFNTKLLSLKTAAEALKDPEDFYVFSTTLSSDNGVDADSLLSVSTSSSAAKGTYEIVVSSVAKAQKLSSRSFAGSTDALGDTYAGDILVNGVAINISASDDLSDVRDKINNANSGSNPSGVSASIVNYGINDFRLILTSTSTGADGIGLQNASASGLLELFGWKDDSESLKNDITGGAQSDGFSASSQSIQSLLDLSSAQSGTIQIRDGNDVYQTVSIDFADDSLEDIKTAINAAAIAGVSASIVTETGGGTTTYRLQIDGSQDFIDDQNMLETLGILQQGVSAVQGTTSGNSMTADGAYLTASTRITEIDGYNQFTAGDTISLGAAARDHDNNDVSGTLLTLSATTTVQDLLDAIKTAYEANGNSVDVYLTSNGKIQVADLESEAGSLTVDLQSSIADSNSALDWGAFSALDEVRKRELIAGADAAVMIDGVTVTSSDNTIEDVVPGVTLNLLRADSSEPKTTITLNVDHDLDAIMEKMDAFVKAYNEVSAYIHKQQAYDEEEEKTGGVLFGDPTLTSVKSNLTAALIQTVWGVDSDFAIPGLVGINVDRQGQLSIDSARLKGYLKSNFNDVVNLFAANGSAEGGSLEFISHARETQAGEYTVHITQAATQSSAFSDNGGVGEDEILTISEGDKVAEIALTTSMTLADIQHAINSEMDQVYTETLIGDAQLYEGSGATTALSATTLWNQIYVDGGTSANIADEDVISFSGTDRSGGTISGSYTIGSAATDTVQGLLSEIEAAFGKEVSAAVDGNGRIVVIDKSTGNSDLSLTFDYSQAHALSFGSSVSAVNDGGQEGRYAMAITASDDGNGHLVLAHDSFGSSYGFSIAEDAVIAGNKLWTAGDQTVDNGLDVAGTINGEAATGSGQILTGNDGESNIDGLVVKYTGTESDLDVGTVKVTNGTAEMFNRVLYSITDKYNGYVAFKMDSLQSSIKGYDVKIEEMETQLDRKMELMINRFVAMETALSQMQSQSSWLASQLNALQG